MVVQLLNVMMNQFVEIAVVKINERTCYLIYDRYKNRTFKCYESEMLRQVNGRGLMILLDGVCVLSIGLGIDDCYYNGNGLVENNEMSCGFIERFKEYFDEIDKND